jgi:hypothetical protein
MMEGESQVVARIMSSWKMQDAFGGSMLDEYFQFRTTR